MGPITGILRGVSAGDADARKKLLEHVYSELHRMARVQMGHERAGHTLQATALVHEAYLRLFAGVEPSFENRAHFFTAAAEAMRRILVDQARRRGGLKRGGGRRRVELPDLAAPEAPDPDDVLAVHEALETLERLDPRLAGIVKLRCFVGMSIAQTADALGLSSRTVNRQWIVAAAWLRARLAGPDTPAAGDGPEGSASGE